MWRALVWMQGEGQRKRLKGKVDNVAEDAGKWCYIGANCASDAAAPLGPIRHIKALMVKAIFIADFNISGPLQEACSWRFPHTSARDSRNYNRYKNKTRR